MSVATAHRNPVEVRAKTTASRGIINSITVFLQAYKAKKQAKKILSAINEAEEIHTGRKEGQSFDDFFSEF